ncbi:MAG TPA: GH3 auxin-responsive promoter family protein [Cyclobacteriaceae bacterium]
MSIKPLLSKPLAKIIAKNQYKFSNNADKYQSRTLKVLVNKSIKTIYGNDHNFKDINNYDDFKNAVPIKDYEGLKYYIDLLLEGQPNVLWPGKPAYFAKTSGTTSGTKYIPVTKDSIPNHINSARNALLSYINNTRNTAFIDGKMIFLSGSPVLTKTSGINTGRLSGLVNHHVPGYLRRNQLPSYDTNCMEDWEAKVDKIVEETIDQDMRLISGIPPWVQMYLDKLSERSGKKIKELFPNFSLFVYGGVNFEPYRKKLFESIGKKVDAIETYPASEGFIAYQDSQEKEGLLLLVNTGIFFEFIPADKYFENNPPRYSIDQVETGVNYALIINSNAGLWGYSIGDTVKFLSLNPPRLVVTGRIKHFISAFGEHVIGEEVERAIFNAQKKFPEVELVEFTVAPKVTPKEGLPLHEWYIEFAKEPNDLSSFEKELDLCLRKLNPYYDDLISGNVLRPLKIFSLRNGSFINYMKSEGKLGGQNKVPRLANDRRIADKLNKLDTIKDAT